MLYWESTIEAIQIHILFTEKEIMVFIFENFHTRAILIGNFK